MKRIIKVLTLSFLLLFVCGCDNQLVCEKKVGNQSYYVKVSFTKEDNPSKATYEIRYTYDSLDAYIDMKLLETQEEYSVFDNINGLEYNIKEDGNDLVIKFNIDYSIYDNRRPDIPILIDTMANNKINLENLSYQCK